MRRTLASLTVAAALVLSAIAPAAVADDSTEIHPDVEYALANQPGGIATGYDSAVWPALGMELQVQSEYARAVGTCATGSICAYSSSGLGGTKLSWTTCGSKSTAALATVGSIANARTSGTLQARQGTTVRASAGANSQANVPIAYWSTITNIFC